MSITEKIRQTDKDLSHTRDRAQRVHEKSQDTEQNRREIADEIRSLVAKIDSSELEAAVADTVIDTSELEDRVTALRLDESRIFRKSQVQQKAFIQINGEVATLEKKLHASKSQVTSLYGDILPEKIAAARFAMAEVIVCTARSQGIPLGGVSPHAIFNRKIVETNYSMATSDPTQLVNIVGVVGNTMKEKFGA